MKTTFRINIEDDNTFSGSNTRKNVIFNGVSNVKASEINKTHQNNTGEQKIFKVQTLKTSDNPIKLDNKENNLQEQYNNTIEKKKIGVFKKTSIKNTKEIGNIVNSEQKESVEKINYDTKIKKSAKRPFNNRKSYQEIFENENKNLSSSGDSHSKRYSKLSSVKKNSLTIPKEVVKLKKTNNNNRNSVDKKSSVKQNERIGSISQDKNLRNNNKNNLTFSKDKDEDFWKDDNNVSHQISK